MKDKTQKTKLPPANPTASKEHCQVSLVYLWDPPPAIYPGLVLP
jgi:hypothetical protein